MPAILEKNGGKPTSKPGQPLFSIPFCWIKNTLERVHHFKTKNKKLQKELHVPTQSLELLWIIHSVFSWFYKY